MILGGFPILCHPHLPVLAQLLIHLHGHLRSPRGLWHTLGANLRAAVIGYRQGTWGTWLSLCWWNCSMPKLRIDIEHDEHALACWWMMEMRVTRWHVVIFTETTQMTNIWYYDKQKLTCSEGYREFSPRKSCFTVNHVSRTRKKQGAFGFWFWITCTSTMCTSSIDSTFTGACTWIWSYTI